MRKNKKEFLNLLKNNLKEKIHFKNDKTIDDLTDDDIENGVVLSEMICDFNVRITPSNIDVISDDWERCFTCLVPNEENLSNLSLLIKMYKRGFDNGYTDGVSDGKSEIQWDLKKLLNI